jgi:hypothetical protein
MTGEAVDCPHWTVMTTRLAGRSTYQLWRVAVIPMSSAPPADSQAVHPPLGQSRDEGRLRNCSRAARVAAVSGWSEPSARSRATSTSLYSASAS